MNEYTLLPFLGRKSDVPIDDFSLFQSVGTNVVMTHDVGGMNFDITRLRMACSKSNGYTQWSNSAISSAANCMGLFELYDGTNRDHIFFDHGKCYIYDSSNDPQLKEDASSTTFASDSMDLYSIIKVGDYMVFADHAEHTPYKWKHGDANLTKLIASGTEYKFRYLLPFQRRVIGAYTDQTDGDIEIRYSTPWPETAITSLNFPASNQLYIPNDDPITGIVKIGFNKALVLCENSIHDLIYYQNYETPFGIVPLIEGNGFTNHHSIVNVGGRILGFNKNYGFCSYTGGSIFPENFTPISKDIERDIGSFMTDYYELIYGKLLPSSREVAWTAPYASITPSRIYFYNLDTGQWRFDDKAMRVIDNWVLTSSYTWNDFVAELGGSTSLWQAVGSGAWANYTSLSSRPVYANQNGHLYRHTGENLDGSAINGYRVEPALDFGDNKTMHLINEIWFGIVSSANYALKVWMRGGNTIGELSAKSWIAQDNLSLDNPYTPIVRTNLGQAFKYHQIKWGTDGADEKFEINKITFRYVDEGGY